MKKFISMVMAAAMVVSLVPATAFAAGDVKATAKVVDAATIEDGGSAYINWNTAPELQLKVTEADYQTTTTGAAPTTDITVTLDGAKFEYWNGTANVACENARLAYMVEVTRGTNTAQTTSATNTAVAGTLSAITAITAELVDEDEVKLSITGYLEKDDVISFNLESVLTDNDAVHVATVSVESDLIDVEDLVYATVADKGIEASVKKTVDVAEEEFVALHDGGLKIKSTVDNSWTTGDVLKLKLSKGFEWANTVGEIELTAGSNVKYTPGEPITVDGDTIEIELGGWAGAEEEFIIYGLEVEADTAKAGDIATVTVKMEKLPSVKVEVAQVVDYKVIMSLVDEDEDVPVFYSGVDAANRGLTVEDEHISLEVEIAETFAGAWSHHKELTLSLPEGVYVVEADGVVVDSDMKGFNDTQLLTAFQNAYQKGDNEEFVFAKRTFNETDPNGDDAQSMKFTLELVAEPGFVGDVVLTMEGAAVDTQEVVIAKFVAPFTVKAEQNDVIIDYRYTEVPTDIVITEAEAGLWDDATATAAAFRFTVERGDYIEFEDEAVYTVNEESEMEIDDTTTLGGRLAASSVGFVVEESSDEEAAEVTISGIELFMQRSIPAGPYDLTIETSMGNWFLQQPLFAADHRPATGSTAHTDDCTCVVDDIDDVETTVKEAWINVVTAGRDQDDASFTTEVVVPVGETTIYAGDKAITLDVPAYINADGYTMLPVRAVATALGINNNAVQWDQATKTVIIMYGQRIITMTAGSSVIYVSGTAIPAKSAVEIVDGRAFLGLRDLATTLGVSEIAWDATTSVATLNPKA